MNKESKRNSKAKVLAVIGGGVAILGLTVASAVSLGIESNHDLGAGTSVTASCQPAGQGNDITVGFDEPTYVDATQGFTVDTVNLGNVAFDCDGKSYKVVVADEFGSELGVGSGNVSGTSVAVTLNSAVDSATVGSVSVVIYDN